MTSPKIVLFGRFGSGNIGNDSSLEAALHNIRMRCPDKEIICVCNGPDAIAERFSITALPVDIAEHRDRRDVEIDNRFLRTLVRLASRLGDEISFWLNRTRWFQPGDQFIIVGTGAVDDMAVKPWNAPYDLYKWCKCAKLGGAKVIFLSVGVGPIVNRVSRLLMLSALRMADYRSYRDLESLNFLKRNNFDVSSDYIFPDLVFSLDKRYLETNERAKKSEVTVGVGLLNYYGWEHDPALGESIYQEYIAKIKQFITWLLDSGYLVRILRGDSTDDRPVNEILEYIQSRKSSLGNDKVIAGEIHNIDELFEQIEQTDIVVASRFHNVLCSLMLKRPAISIGYHVKNIELMNAFGLREYCQEIESFKVEELIRQLSMYKKNMYHLIDRIHEQNTKNRQLLEEQYETLFPQAKDKGI